MLSLVPDAPDTDVSRRCYGQLRTVLGAPLPGAVGKIIRQGEGFKNNLHIVGVLRDVRFKGTRKAVQPTIFFNDRKYSNQVSLRLAGGNSAMPSWRGITCTCR